MQNDFKYVRYMGVGAGFQPALKTSGNQRGCKGGLETLPYGRGPLHNSQLLTPLSTLHSPHSTLNATLPSYSFRFLHNLGKNKEGIAMTEEHFPHKLTLNERKSLTMTGVTEVLRFEDTAVVLQTPLGTAVIQGQDLKLKTLSLEGGQMAVEGKISGISYEEPREGGLWQRLWR